VKIIAKEEFPTEKKPEEEEEEEEGLISAFSKLIGKKLSGSKKRFAEIES
jgi:hypothetical protein